jgi:hypothetical protein
MHDGDKASQASSSTMETKARLALWLLMIRSRLSRLGDQVVRGRSRHHPTGWKILRQHCLVDHVLRGWMEGVIMEAGPRTEDMLTLLRLLINLLLYEARAVCDYRCLFPFLAERINVHVLRLLQRTDPPVIVAEMVFADTAAPRVR